MLAWNVRGNSKGNQQAWRPRAILGACRHPRRFAEIPQVGPFVGWGLCQEWCPQTPLPPEVRPQGESRGRWADRACPVIAPRYRTWRSRPVSIGHGRLSTPPPKGPRTNVPRTNVQGMLSGARSGSCKGWRASGLRRGRWRMDQIFIFALLLAVRRLRFGLRHGHSVAQPESGGLSVINRQAWPCCRLRAVGHFRCRSDRLG